MKIVNLFTLCVLLVGFLFVMGIIASSAQTLSPIPVGEHYIQFNKVAEVGEGLRGITEDIAAKEINSILALAERIEPAYWLRSRQDLYRIKNLTERSA